MSYACWAALCHSPVETWPPNCFFFSFFSLSCNLYTEPFFFIFISFDSEFESIWFLWQGSRSSYKLRPGIFFRNFWLTTRRVKRVWSSLTVLERFSDLHLRIEISAKLLHRSCVELFLVEYINISGLNSHRKSSDLKIFYHLLTSRNVLGSWRSVGLASLFVLVQVSSEGGFQRWSNETLRQLFSVSSQFSP